ncbi:hypothetical protein BJY04DRAFT_216233 [Aspergillus karnatakaensis]|uniref:uncharacterized protein n=1 Tax=Aspergillus karnatakaensis TaxID=1810916 RepID=UPI003CCD9DF2
MKFSAVASVACMVAGVSAFQYPDFVPLHKRQAPGTPQYECHANCGGIITASRTEGYCDSSDFESLLSACLDCALEYDIWRYYGNSVSAAAEECGLDATPVEPEEPEPTSSTTSTSEPEPTATETETETETEPEPTATETQTETETEPTATTTSTSTEDEEPTSSDSTSVSSTPVIPTVTTTTSPTPPGSTGTPTPGPEDPEFTGAAALNTPAGIVMGGLLGSLMAAFM